jgi:mRNA interferase HigB
VRVISKRGLWLRAAKFADSKIALRIWLETAEFASWSSLQEIRQAFPATDMIGNIAIFNIKGDRYRLIVRIEFHGQRLYIKEFLTHAEYDKGAWKKWL